MSKRDIAEDVWEIFRKVYDIKPNVTKSEKQVALVKSLVEYVESLNTEAKENKHVSKSNRTNTSK
jgi:hypothetical protein